MAEILLPGKTGPRIKVKKASVRIDLTPMVDLGFLLITFFVFTTTLSEPKAMSLVIPGNGDSSETPERKTLNLVLGKNNKVHYYIGRDVGKQICTDFSTDGVRNVIRGMQKSVSDHFGSPEELVVLIRPTAESSYMNLVDILDEMVILNVKKYVLMDDPADHSSTVIKVNEPC